MSLSRLSAMPPRRWVIAAGLTRLPWSVLWPDQGLTHERHSSKQARPTSSGGKGFEKVFAFSANTPSFRQIAETRRDRFDSERELAAQLGVAGRSCVWRCARSTCSASSRFSDRVGRSTRSAARTFPVLNDFSRLRAVAPRRPRVDHMDAGPYCHRMSGLATRSRCRQASLISSGCRRCPHDRGHH